MANNIKNKGGEKFDNVILFFVSNFIKIPSIIRDQSKQFTFSLNIKSLDEEIKRRILIVRRPQDTVLSKYIPQATVLTKYISDKIINIVLYLMPIAEKQLIFKNYKDNLNYFLSYILQIFYINVDFNVDFKFETLISKLFNELINKEIINSNNFPFLTNFTDAEIVSCLNLFIRDVTDEKIKTVYDIIVEKINDEQKDEIEQKITHTVEDILILIIHCKIIPFISGNNTDPKNHNNIFQRIIKWCPFLNVSIPQNIVNQLNLSFTPTIPCDIDHIYDKCLHEIRQLHLKQLKKEIGVNHQLITELFYYICCIMLHKNDGFHINEFQIDLKKLNDAIDIVILKIYEEYQYWPLPKK